MAAEVPIDVVEQILLGLDVKDIIRCKSVCKSWHSFISSPAFVQAHLKRQNDNIGGHRRISMDSSPVADEVLVYILNDMFIVGSCNGLVCVTPKGAEFEVANPCTREIKKLQTASFYPPDEILTSIRQKLILGFGYDASTDDYKVVVGFRKSHSDQRTCFYALALKSNVWKFIGEVNCRVIKKYAGTFYGGALHWFMFAAGKEVIMSVDLSTNECKEIPQPAADVGYETADLYEHNLGVIEGCLCVYSSKSKKIWVMKNNKWELYNNFNNECRYDTAHRLRCLPVVDSQNMTSDVYTIDDGRPVPSAHLHFLRASMFVKSLVNPQVKELEPEANNDSKGNIKKRRKI